MGSSSNRRKGHKAAKARPTSAPPRLESLERRLVLSALTIAQENALPGTPQSTWDVSGAGDPTLQGFATNISVNVGQTVQFKITDTTGAAYHIDIYRMGYYQGNGARLVTSIPSSQTIRTAQPAPISDPTTGLIDCGNWSVSASWAVPTDATSGVYFARLTRDDTGGASHVVFVVRNDASHSDLLFQTSDSTWEAYNTYGGNSLYQGNSTIAPGRAVKVSYNRPFNDRATSGGFGETNWVFHAEYPMVRWLEKNGYDVSYFTDVDSDRNGALIKNHKVFMSVGHDEYWSGAQRANVEGARDAGVNLAFFSGNESYWKTRYETSVDGSGTAYRTLVCYKETHANAVTDPLDPTVWTGTWRDPRFSPPADGNRPENAMSGTIFTVDRGPNDVGTPLTVPAIDAGLRIWRNTPVAQLTTGQSASLGTAVLGYEWDEDLDNGSRPAGLIDLSSTTQNVTEKITDYGTGTAPGVATHSVTFYKAPSGARVFSVGTVQWAWGLDATHDGIGGGAADATVQQATVNLLADENAQPATLQPGLVAATASTDAIKPTSTIVSPGNSASFASGSPVTITGTATDTGGGVVGGVEVSTDGGATWHPASGRGQWTYTWIPGPLGTSTIKTRATDDSGNTETPSAGITVTVTQPTAPLSVWGTPTPLVTSASDTGGVELGVHIRSDINGYITGIRFYKGSGNGGTHVGSLWSSTGTLLARATFTSESATGWQQVSFGAPVAVTAGTTYVASYYAPSGAYAYDSGYFATTPADNGPLHALPDTSAARNGMYAYAPSSTFPSQTFGSNNYWVDVVFTTTLVDTTPPTVTAESPAPSSINADPASVVTATFSESIKPATLSFVLSGTGGQAVSATVTYDDVTHKATLTPTSPLAAGTTYTAVVSGAQDQAGNPMASPVSWTFTTVPAGSATYSIWTTPTPTNPASSDGGAVELGVKFRTDTAGFITGVRFYKGSGNAGTHIGNLWSSTGQLLATATFTGESASGWQTVTFASPVAVSANTVYVASYYAPVGHYAFDGAYFAGAGVDNGPLHALANGVSGGDGVYAYAAASAFPANTFNSTNYWVDVVFTTTTPAHSWKQTTVADFAAGTSAGTTVTNAAGGEVSLAQSTDTFAGSTLGPAWSTVSWASAGGGPTSVGVAGGILSVAGAEVRSISYATATPVEAVLSFGAAPYQHFGLATDVNTVSSNNWAMFSTMGTTNTLFARVNANGATQDVSLGALPSGYHTYRVQPVAGAFEFFVDGVLQATLNAGFASGSPLSAFVSAYSGAPSPALLVDSMTSGPFGSSGTFTSSVFDAGATAQWGNASWTAVQPANTLLVVQARSGNTAVPDGTWSSWATVNNGAAVGVPSSRYLQYRLTFTTTDSLQTPTLSDILFSWS